MTPAERARYLLAGKLELIRRGNPSMSGPSAMDYRVAQQLIEHLEGNGLRIVEADGAAP